MPLSKKTKPNSITSVWQEYLKPFNLPQTNGIYQPLKIKLRTDYSLKNHLYIYIYIYIYTIWHQVTYIKKQPSTHPFIQKSIVLLRYQPNQIVLLVFDRNTWNRLTYHRQMGFINR